MIEIAKVFPVAQLKAALKHGPVMVKSKPGATAASSGAVQVAAVPKKVWRFLTDYGSHPEVLRVIASEKLVHRDDTRAEVRMKFGVHVSMVRIGVDLTMDVTEHPEHRIDFVLRDGRTVRFNGYWEVVPLDHHAAVLFGLEGDVRHLGWPVRAILDRFHSLDSGIASAIVSAILTDMDLYFSRSGGRS
ncbi:MAG: SRPBCC family protein [Nitrospirae bacterium]|nr:SRPBCC family protein [Nitrospirota bacterium]